MPNSTADAQLMSTDRIDQLHAHHAHNNSKNSAWNNITFWMLIIYLSTGVFEGPLRYLLQIANLGTYIYLRDFIIATVVLGGIFRALVIRRKISEPVVVFVYVLCTFWFLDLLIFSNTLFSTLFGLKILSVFLLGLASAEAVASKNETFHKILICFVIFSIAGVYLNYFYGKLPWEGISYDTAFGEVSTTKEWWSSGSRRLAGFARASYDAAMIIGLGGTILIATKRRWVILIGGLVIGSAVYLTTSKGMVLSISILVAWLFLMPLQIRYSTGVALCTLATIAMVALPASSCIYSFNPRLPDQLPSVFFSFSERLVSMWPNSCKLLSTPYSWILGAGIGSIGVPQKYASLTGQYSSADNLFVYIYATGGIIWTYAMLRQVGHLLRSASNLVFNRIAVVSMLIVLLTYGTTTNMIEQSFFTVVAGLLVGGNLIRGDKVT
jgi:hypothetical protein